MLTVSLWLIAAAIIIGSVAFSIAISLDRREQDRRARQRGSVHISSAQPEPTTAVEWGRTLILGGDDSTELHSCPDIIIGPWTSTTVSIEESPRKAA